MEFPGFRHAGRQIAAQRHDAADALGLILAEYFADIVVRRTDAGKVWCRLKAFGSNFPDHGKTAFTRRTARAVGDGKKFGLEHRQIFSDLAQFFHAFRRLRREKLDGEIQ